MKIYGNEVLWKSEKENVAVAFNQFDLGNKYKVYRKVSYLPENYRMWECLISFCTMGEATSYAKKIYDVLVMR